jgi:DNA repair protein RecN (Recombination protein N)
MLERLTVKNLAVVEHAEIAFGAGLNVITGETGSGKSVLMGAVELVLGARAEADVVRSGAKEAEIEAVFEGKTLRRTLTAAGRSRAWIDDESVTISELREFGVGLVDIHGPRANQELLEESFQRSTIVVPQPMTEDMSNAAPIANERSLIPTRPR